MIELPEPRFTRMVDGVRCLTITEHEAQLQAYGEACRKEALEEAENAIDEANRRRVVYLPECIEIIRSLI